MAKNSDIIKIGFDYKASLEQFLKETNGAFDELDVKAGKQKIFIQFDAKNEKVLEKIKELQKLKLNDFTFEFGESGLSEQLKTFDLLEKKIIEIINLSKGIGSTVGSGTGVGNSIVDEKTLNSVIELFGKIESHLSDMKAVFVDVGDGEEFSPLLKVIKEVQTAIDGLRKSVSGISLNMNIDVGSNNQAEAKINEKMSKHLFAYKELFEKLFHSSFDAVITDELFEFEKIIDRYDTTVGKIAAYEKEIDKLVKYSNDRYGKNILKNNDTKGAWSSVSATKSQWTKAKNELNKANDATDTDLSDLFGKTDLTDVVSQLELVVNKLTEISTVISELSDGFKNTFKDGVNVSASVEELEKLTSKIKELEAELSTLKGSADNGQSGSSKSGGKKKKSDNKQVNEQAENYKKLNDEIKRYETVQKRIAGGNALSTDVEESERLRENIIALQKEPLLSKKQLEESERKLRSIADVVEDIKERTKNTTLDSLQSQIDSFNKTYTNLNLKPKDVNRNSDYTKALNEYKEAINALIVKKKELEESPNAIGEKEISEWNELTNAVEEAHNKIKAFTAAEKGSDEASRIKEIDKLTKYLEKNTRISREAKAELKKYLDMLRSNDPSTNVKELHAAWTRVAIAEREAGREGKNFWDIMTDKAFQNRAAQLVSYYLSFTDIIRYGTQAFNTLRELDTALIDLKKTTAMSTSQMEAFYYEANDVAKEMGVTTTAIIEQASAWSRLNKIGLLYGDI